MTQYHTMIRIIRKRRTGEMEELLREAACLGNTEAVQKLLRHGAAINAQHTINGWTPLHWACKRGHVTIVECLLEAGADVSVKTYKGESLADVTSCPQVAQLLQNKSKELVANGDRPSKPLSITPSYLLHPPFPYYDVEKSMNNIIPTTSNCRSNNTSSEPYALLESQPPFQTHTQSHSHVSNKLQSHSHVSKELESHSHVNSLHTEVNTDVPCEGVSELSLHCTDYAGQMSSVTSTAADGSVGSLVPHTQPSSSSFPLSDPSSFIPVASSSSLSSSSNGPLPLVVKVRLCGSGESDFVEVEVPSLSYQTLLQVCCEEMEVAPTDVAKIRKLPNVLIRKDRDIQRMKDGQELEMVMKNETTSPCDL